MEHKNESFSYTYSAKQQEEVKRILQKYEPQEENKLEQLRRLDKSAARPGKLLSIIVGVVSALVFGVGLCCTTVWTEHFMLGIGIGVLGLMGISVAYPLSVAITKRQRKKLAPDIIKLSADWMEQK